MDGESNNLAVDSFPYIGAVEDLQHMTARSPTPRRPRPPWSPASRPATACIGVDQTVQSKRLRRASRATTSTTHLRDGRGGGLGDRRRLDRAHHPRDAGRDLRPHRQSRLGRATRSSATPQAAGLQGHRRPAGELAGRRRLRGRARRRPQLLPAARRRPIRGRGQDRPPHGRPRPDRRNGPSKDNNHVFVWNSDGFDAIDWASGAEGARPLRDEPHGIRGRPREGQRRRAVARRDDGKRRSSACSRTRTASC